MSQTKQSNRFFRTTFKVGSFLVRKTGRVTKSTAKWAGRQASQAYQGAVQGTREGWQDAAKEVK